MSGPAGSQITGATTRHPDVHHVGSGSSGPLPDPTTPCHLGRGIARTRRADGGESHAGQVPAQAARRVEGGAAGCSDRGRGEWSVVGGRPWDAAKTMRIGGDRCRYLFNNAQRPAAASTAIPPAATAAGRPGVEATSSATDDSASAFSGRRIMVESWSRISPLVPAPSMACFMAKSRASCPADGSASPRSHLETAIADTPSHAPSSACDSLRAERNILISKGLSAHSIPVVIFCLIATILSVSFHRMVIKATYGYMLTASFGGSN